MRSDNEYTSQRLHINNKSMTKFMEFVDDETGMKDAKKFRKNHPDYKGQRIKHILQMYFYMINCGFEYDLK
jgi:hypothetical protein